MENLSVAAIPAALFEKYPRRGYRRGTTVFTAHNASDALAVLRQAVPDLQRQDYEDHARRHALASLAASRKYVAELHAAALETWGRPFEVKDYKISGIASEEFSEPRKAVLRELRTIESRHHRLAIVHAMGAGRSHRTALRWYEQFMADQQASLAPRASRVQVCESELELLPC